MAKRGTESKKDSTQPKLASPEIKLTPEMTPVDMTHIAQVTGGRISEIPQLRPHYPRLARLRLDEDASIIFINTPVEVARESRNVRIELEGDEINLSETAVILGAEQVTFVHPPELSMDPPGTLVRTLAVSSGEVLIRRRVLPLDGSKALEEDVMRATHMVDQAVQARQRARLRQ